MYLFCWINTSHSHSIITSDILISTGNGCHRRHGSRSHHHRTRIPLFVSTSKCCHNLIHDADCHCESFRTKVDSILYTLVVRVSIHFQQLQYQTNHQQYDEIDPHSILQRIQSYHTQHNNTSLWEDCNIKTLISQDECTIETSSTSTPLLFRYAIAHTWCVCVCLS